MEQIGYVNKIDGNTAQVVVRRVSLCGDKCTSCKGSCNVPGISVNIENVLGAKEGDFVEVRMKTKTVLKSAFLVYAIPLVMLIIGITAGISIFKNLGFSNYESYGFLTGLIFLGISYIVLRKIDNYIKKKNSLVFEMVRIIKE